MPMKVDLKIKALDFSTFKIEVFMPAITHLCEKVNISLFDDTITVYPKNYPKNSSQWAPELLDLFQFHPNEFKNKDWVVRFDAKHHMYHKDNFSWDDTHYHIRYNKTIDEARLQKILAVFVKFNVISPIEEQSFLTVYRLVALPNALQDQLALIQTKAAIFRSRAEKEISYTPARDAAENLYKDLSAALAEYNKNPKTKDSYTEFQKVSSAAINKAKPILEEHRGWKKILGNVGLAIGLLGVGYVIAGLINLKVNNQFLFFNKTDSAKKVDKLEELVRNQPAPAA